MPASIGPMPAPWRRPWKLHRGSSYSGTRTTWAWGIVWGEEWQKKLEEALLNCNTFLLLVSPGGARNWTLAETQVALSRHFGAKDDCKRLLILPLLLPKATTDLLPPFLDLFQAETWPVEYPPDDAQAFARWLLPRLQARLDNRRVGLGLPRIKLKEGQNPFRGLAFYREEDAPFFFGRQVDTVELLHCLGSIERGRRRRWLQIEGESGSGKSSLIHAGLLPAIRRGWRGFNDGVISDCVILEPMRPGKDVLRELATALYRAPGNKQLSSKAIKDALCTDGDEVLAHYLRDLRPSKSHALLLVIDQFEELLTVAENMDDIRRFDRQLAAALEDEGTGLYLITGVRSDFLNFDDLPRLQNCLNNLGTRPQFNKVNERQLYEIIFQGALQHPPAQRPGVGEPSVGDPALDRGVQFAEAELAALPGLVAGREPAGGVAAVAGLEP